MYRERVNAPGGSHRSEVPHTMNAIGAASLGSSGDDAAVHDDILAFDQFAPSTEAYSSRWRVNGRAVPNRANDVLEFTVFPEGVPVDHDDWRGRLAAQERTIASLSREITAQRLKNAELEATLDSALHRPSGSTDGAT